MSDKRKAYVEKFDAQLNEWNAEIALFRAKADKARAEAKIEYYKTIKILEGKLDVARTNLHELRNAGADAREDLEIGAEKVWTEVKTAFHDAASRFK